MLLRDKDKKKKRNGKNIILYFGEHFHLKAYDTYSTFKLLVHLLNFTNTKHVWEKLLHEIVAGPQSSPFICILLNA